MFLYQLPYLRLVHEACMKKNICELPVYVHKFFPKSFAPKGNQKQLSTSNCKLLCSCFFKFILMLLALYQQRVGGVGVRKTVCHHQPGHRTGHSAGRWALPRIVCLKQLFKFSCLPLDTYTTSCAVTVCFFFNLNRYIT